MTVRNLSKRQIFLLLGDVGIVLFSLNMALIIRTGERLTDFVSFHNISPAASLVIAYIASFYIFEFYNIRFKFRSFKFLGSMGGAFGLTYLFVILWFYIFPYELGRGVFFISWILTGLFVFGWRLVYLTLFKLADPPRKVLILGDGARTKSIIDALNNNPEFMLTAILDNDSVKEKLGRETASNEMSTIGEFIEKNRINDIVVNYEIGDSSELERSLVNCRMRGISCYTVEAFYERILEKLPVSMLSNQWFLMSGGFDKLGSRIFRALKRAVDIGAAALFILITLPFSIVIALLIPMTSKGPAFFTQERLGVGKRPFRIIKFRTMVHNAEADGPLWAQNNDGRVTKLGKNLRKTRLDEIPQFINVLKGEMSLVGPRPEREYFANQLTEKIPFYSLRFFVKPGITGWAQVNFHYGSNDEDALEKLRYELYYIKNQSLFLDFRIMIKTIRVAFFGLGT